MHETNIHKLNLNLLKTLDAVLTEKSVSRAADKIFLSQPALSHALSQLRELLDDAILIRSAQGMELTEYARSIAPEVKQILGAIDNLFTDTSAFDPVKSEHTFRIGYQNDMVSYSFVPLLMQWISEHDSEFKVSVSHLSRQEAVYQLDGGQIDIFICGELTRKPKYIVEKLIMQSRFVCLLRKSHPLTARSMSLKKFLSYPQIAYAGRIIQHGLSMVDESLKTRGLQRNIVLTLDTHASLGPALETTDMLAIMTEIQAKIHAEQYHLKILSYPKELPNAEVNGYLYWHKRMDKQPALNWLIDFFTDMYNDN